MGKCGGPDYEREEDDGKVDEAHNGSSKSNDRRAFAINKDDDDENRVFFVLI